MSPIRLESTLEFHAVGQGLCASGDLKCFPGIGAPFRWVYDCGTVSGAFLVKHAIDKMKSDWPVQTVRPKLDLVTVSHFDEDHISGLVTLLRTFEVGTLLLPYMPLEQRLAAAFAEGVNVRQELMGFFTNPVVFLAERGEVSIDRIVLVRGADGAGPVVGEPQDPQLPEAGIPWSVILEGEEPDPPRDSPDSELAAGLNTFRDRHRSSSTKVTFLRPGGRVTASGVWEFVPYNDAEVARKPTAGFRRAVASKRSELLAAGADSARTRELAALKSMYDDHFGKTAKARNIISLFLFSGPIGTFRQAWHSTWTRHGREIMQRGWLASDESRCGVLFTGDGYLDTKARLERMTNHFGPVRIKRTACLQVMHHGAERNWHRGVAARLAPDVSVFSSDPSRRNPGHPHGPVVRDFLPYGPVQVDKESGFFVRSTLWSP